jgi:hypothetical protein
MGQHARPGGIARAGLHTRHGQRPGEQQRAPRQGMGGRTPASALGAPRATARPRAAAPAGAGCSRCDPPPPKNPREWPRHLGAMSSRRSVFTWPGPGRPGRKRPRQGPRSALAHVANAQGGDGASRLAFHARAAQWPPPRSRPIWRIALIIETARKGEGQTGAEGSGNALGSLLNKIEAKARMYSRALDTKCTMPWSNKTGLGTR